ncbi:hypothetical protein A3D42_00840 [Candidatus Nomurabacteria bacterium RIFCSPHIGHO2_02_FULL_41_18]|uniref:Uncharacterized protein n=1 Tax=Candidatus Nomurabacteria bacterium RIFCSPHIGHO2_02_FULL_41_18 TaxID=1801754 RepID=A0A1F6W5G9_9BACT|nr:MAG: hypothetical protein A2737_00960 [Candidatus Nomurabacteria bacterium RIFCSPHIGHO2_01_FULL_41_71]OGI77052.1 MAG: hypothetical protein A3D42_00840 [Candidatus Nomurabacteria bacterium RIFCSPHIGHO2_02_FULL_41_18]OGI90144.1 MAG: hypothetical protein A3B01_02485 [Candidatus Nomurabacteria bacterium RIFCSPLOWO2_01_FULL_41_52b]OGJ00470.1 MAG: hypothetical protein A3I90_02210 [Candidatus Nomurabacteria bacterium RIFCSPLOWO2_02_FULL_41_9]
MEIICIKCKQNFILDKDDIGFYQKMKVPNPKICPDCRFKMKAMFRNETTLYSGRKCELCGKSIISMYHPKSPYTIFCYDCFYSEKWEARDYAMDYNPDESFVQQFGKLLKKVPKISTYLSLGYGVNINSEYTNMASGCRNCYLVFNTGPAEDSMYSRGLRNTLDCSDIYFGTKIERCYESINAQESSGILWGQNITGSVDSAFVLNGRNLINCFGCVNLNNKSHYFLNKPMAVDEYNKKVSEIMGSYQKIEEFKKEFKKFCLNFPRRENNNIQTVNSTGDYLFECRNVRDAFEITKSENCRYLFSSKEIKDSIGTIGYGVNSEHLLEVVATGLCSNVVGSYGTENSQDILYGFYIVKCKDCIGCDGLKNGKYYILNKEYKKAAYEKLRDKIIEELKEKDLYGLMIPPELAPFAYNETIAQDNIPLTKEQAMKEGLKWEDNIQKTEGKETMKIENIPDHIKNAPNSIVNEILACVDCNRNYKIIAQELLFYRKMNIPIPRKCFYCRHKDRITRRGPYKFWNRTCRKCKKEIITNYAPDRPEIVYCEKCYRQEVY